MRLLQLFAILLTLGTAAPAEERRFMISGFQQIRVEGPYEVDVVTGSPRATATGDRRSLDQVTVRVSGETLVVSTGPLSWESRAGGAISVPRVRIAVPSLRSVRISGGARVRVAAMRGGRVDLALNGTGSLDVASIKADELDANLTGTGMMTLAGTGLRGRVRNFGAGSIEAGGLSLGDADLLSQSSGTMRVAVRFTARAAALGAGGIVVVGKPECKVRGPGPVECLGPGRQ